MVINPYISFDGTCKTAFEFYQRILGGDLFTMTYGESEGADMAPAEMHDRLVHARLRSGKAVLMGGDAPSQYASPMAGFCVSISIEDATEGQRIFDALSEGGKVHMPFGKTLFSEAFGMCIDQYGTPWMVNVGAEG